MKLFWKTLFILISIALFARGFTIHIESPRYILTNTEGAILCILLGMIVVVVWAAITYGTMRFTLIGSSIITLITGIIIYNSSPISISLLALFVSHGVLATTLMYESYEKYRDLAELRRISTIRVREPRR